MNNNKIFENKITKNISNNESVYYGTSKEEPPKSNVSVRKKISDIFNSRNYVYKADVYIKTADKVLDKTVIGKNSKYLITSTNELIPIESILDINKKQS